MTDGGEPIDDPADIVAVEFDDVDIEGDAPVGEPGDDRVGVPDDEGDADRLELYFEADDADASDGEISTTAIIGEVTAAADTEALGVVAGRIEHLAETGRIVHEETFADSDSDDNTHDREFIIPDASERVTNVNLIHQITESGTTVTLAEPRISFREGATLDDIERTLTIHRDAATTANGAEIIDDSRGGGRSPLGTSVEGGRLIKDDDYDDVRIQLQMVCSGDKTVSAAANDLGCVRGTIHNAIEDRAAMYQLPQQ